MSEKEIITLLKDKNFIEAKNLIITLLGREKTNLKYNFYYGLILAQERNFEEAIKFFVIFIEGNKKDYDANFNLAGCYLGLLNFKKALEYYEVCAGLKPDKHEPYHQIGVCYRLVREYEKSILNLNKALDVKANPHTYYILGNVFRENGQFEDARKSFNLSIKMNDKFVDSKLSLANLEIDYGDHEKAEKLINKIIISQTDNKRNLVAANVIMGNIFRSKGGYTEAIKVYKKILEEDLDNVNASYNLSLCYLFLKEYDKGWRFHETRYSLQSFVLLRKMSRNLSKPKWDENKPKERVLIYGEQGIGEQILYSQFIQLLQDQFQSVTVAVNFKLVSFLKKIYTNIEIIDYRTIDFFDHYDYHLPMGSLGLYFQKYFGDLNLKREIPYSENKFVVPNKIKKFRCGISWKSTNKIFGNKKSIKLNWLKDFFLLKNIEFINLQYSNEKSEIDDLEKTIGKNIFIKHSVNCFDDIDGVASLIKSCDFVITVSNSNAHISGKLGVKTFLLLPFNEGKLWYWGLNTDNEIIWYPSITPIRMNRENDWNSCLTKLDNLIKNTCK